MARKLILVVVLITAVSLGFSWLTEDLCTAGGSYADDPTSPISMAQYALPLRLQSAHKAAVAVLVLPPVVPSRPLVAEAPPDFAEPSGPSVLTDTPRRC